MTDSTDADVREAKVKAAFKESVHITPDSVQGEAKRTAAVIEPAPVRNEKMIAALRREREGLAALGKTDRVAQVDEQLKYYGYQPDDEGKAVRTQLPQGRSTKPTQVTS